MRQFFPFTEEEKVMTEAVLNNIRKVISYFLHPPLPDFHFEIAVRYVGQRSPTVPKPAKAQGTSHPIHQLCMEGINKKSEVFKT